MPKKSKHVGISKELLAKFKLYSEYAAAAYCIDNNNSPETRVTCPCNNCKLVEAANATTISEFENTIKTDDTGFIAIDKLHKVIVLAFRGSRSKKNWFADLDITRRSTDLCHGCRVHEGFWKSWTEAAPVVIPKIQEAVVKYPDYGVVVTGHSLGAAVATLAAAGIRKLDRHLADKTELYTFGSPRVGDETTAEFLTRQSNKSYRVTAVNDFIPRLPGKILHYKHMSPEYWIDKNPDNPSTADIVVVTGTYNTDGNSGRHGISHKAHGHYLGPIVKCDSSTKARSFKAGHKRDVSGGLDRVGGEALNLLAPYINASMLTVQDSTLGRSITFPPGSVADVALEAVHGPDAGRDASTTVFFGADD
ncbi:MAG: hypothetical protein FRX48_06435 [Lasallia pustulata]|uniref:Fungal lipase-type domain-containing protein n=1 Tax=Lasallia pustulata TaxID=136370 RepID=A0A5M8PK48_9LECA|nr:MAG: hypothetical protein FRX48_06435 [Lasallia pustulata]